TRATNSRTCRRSSRSVPAAFPPRSAAEPAGARARLSRVQVGALVVAVASTGLLVAVAPRHSLLAVLLVAVSPAACAVVVAGERRRPRLGPRPIVGAIGVVFVVALIVPPRASNDIWSYAIYGRMVSVHHASPYEHVPADFRSDPLFDEVSP